MSNIQGVSGTQSPIVAELLASGDPGAEMAALAVEEGNHERTFETHARDAYEQAEAHEDDQEVAAMRQKAEDIRTDAMKEGFGMMAGGAFDIAGGIETANVGSTQASQQGAAGEGAALRGGGEVVKGLATTWAAGDKAAQATDDANAAQHKAHADLAKDAAEDLHDAAKDAGDYVKAALDFYRDYVSTQAQTQGAALHKV
jgi:hypothetical protein